LKAIDISYLARYTCLHANKTTSPNHRLPGPDDHLPNRPEGRIAYDVAGMDPSSYSSQGWVTCGTPTVSRTGAGRGGLQGRSTDLRARRQRRHVQLLWRVETAGDVLALIEELGGPAVIVGNSMGAGAATLAAALQPDLVGGLVLVGPFVRNGEMSMMQRVLLRVAMARPWAASAWKSYMPKLYAGQRPEDFEDYRKQVVASLRRTGYAKAFSLTTRTDHTPAEARLADVSAPALVVMGEQDPTSRTRGRRPTGSRRSWRRGRDGGRSRPLPPVQRPEITTAAIVGFLATVNSRG